MHVVSVCLVPLLKEKKVVLEAELILMVKNYATHFQFLCRYISSELATDIIIAVGEVKFDLHKVMYFCSILVVVILFC